MLPLVKKGDLVEFRMSGELKQARVHQSNPKTVWIILEGQKIIKLHKRKHFVKVLERKGEATKQDAPPNTLEGKEVEKPSKLDDLFKVLQSS